jgi:hypothetical protein
MSIRLNEKAGSPFQKRVGAFFLRKNCRKSAKNLTLYQN